LSQAPSSRTNQKQRTRADLLRAARRLVANGEQPGVAEVADAAGISRATAYRYFSKADDLLREATLEALSDLADPAAAPPDPDISVSERLDGLVARVFALVADNETLFRAFLANSAPVAASERPARGGRRLDWLRTVLQPIDGQLPPPELDRLIHALSLVTGIETLVVLQDVCGLDRDAADRTARWAAQALLAAATRDGER
jgi:AcrR family transcriptional regulator